jgi:ferritin-like metal-binding protein YciE
MKGTFTMAVQNPPSLFLYELCAMYDAEQRLVKTLPILAQECNNQEAKDAFMQHEQETRQHVRNLEQCFQILGSQPTTLENHTISGLKQDHDTFTQQQPPQEALTMFDLNAGYQSEYIEIATYNSLIDAANSMGLQQCVQLFQQNLQQEEAAARKLGSIIHQMGQQSAQMNQGQTSMPNQSYAGSAPPMLGQSYATGNQQTTNQAGMNQGYPVDIQPGQSETFIAGGPQGENPTYTGSSAQPSGSTYTGGSSQVPNSTASSASPNAAMNPRTQMQQGMEVVGQDLGSIGIVKDMRDGDFLVDRKMQRDVYVPYNAIQNIDGGRAVLNIPTGQVDNMGWQNPPLM